MTNPDVERYRAALRTAGHAAAALADALDELIDAAAAATPDGDDPVAVHVVAKTRQRLVPLFRAHPDLLQLLGFNLDAPRKEGN